MPYDLLLPKRFGTLWKVKIQDPRPDPAEVPMEIRNLIAQNHDELCRQWDARFPTNPVAGEEEDDDLI
jgi:hypothetical protein